VKRPSQSLLLFDKSSISVAAPLEPEDLEQSRQSVAEQWAFFWMMTAITIKYIRRGDSVFVAHWLEALQELVHDIERRIQHEPWQYRRGSLSRLRPARKEQVESLRQLCRKMQELAPEVQRFSGKTPALPFTEIETLFSLLNEEYARN
jgi:hypothetical protein